VADERGLQSAVEELAAGEGPLAVDAERASGYRYGQRAYLVQLRRRGVGTLMIDTMACPDLSPLGRAMEGVEWVLHAATQDLPCLAEVGLRPAWLFDTELGARLAGLPRVGLSAVLEHYLGVSLAKEHSAVDWSTRPLPEPWLRYAALDVEVLLELRDAVEDDLRAQQKWDWARQEFEALTSFAGPVARPDPWRRTAGMHKVRGRRAAAVLRELWFARDDIARQRDLSPGRVLPDAVLMALATAAPADAAALANVSSNRSARRYQTQWLQAIERARALPDSALPAASAPAVGPPPARAWADREPVAAARLAQARAELAAWAGPRQIPVETVLSPDSLRRVVWEPPDAELDAVAAALAGRGARAWQVEVAAPIVLAALLAHPHEQA
jgi:ribonuclease D